jgi:hypothetical protein
VIPGASLYALPMTMLVTVAELSLWAEGSYTAIPASDPLANWLLEQASTLVIDECRQPAWTAASAPGRAKIVVANIAKRCWNNADQEVRTAIAGGPSSAVLDEAALGLRLSEAEIIECAKIRQAILDAETPDANGFWTLSITRGPLESSMAYFPDDRWPQSSPIGYLQPTRDPEYFPTTDDPLPLTNVPDEPTNTIL